MLVEYPSSKLWQKSNDQQGQPLNTTKIVVGSAKAFNLSTSPPDTTPARKESRVSVLYGRLLETTEAEEICKRLGMTREDVRSLRRKFDEEDGTNSDTVTIRGFFHLINDDKAYERAHLLIKELLRLGNLGNITPSVTRITFDQFLCIVCTFAAFSELQLWRFYYDAFFADGIDTVSARRLNEVLFTGCWRIVCAQYRGGCSQFYCQRGITDYALVPHLRRILGACASESRRFLPTCTNPAQRPHANTGQEVLGAKGWRTASCTTARSTPSPSPWKLTPNGLQKLDIGRVAKRKHRDGTGSSVSTTTVPRRSS